MGKYEPVFYGAVTVGERGQVVIPQQAREAHGIKPGDKMLVLGGGFDGHGLVMIKADAVSSLLAKLSERVNVLEKVFRMSAGHNDQDCKQNGAGSARLTGPPERESGGAPGSDPY